VQQHGWDEAAGAAAELAEKHTGEGGADDRRRHGEGDADLAGSEDRLGRRVRAREPA
jgi:hypothetical protein